jgi:type VI secretion system protein ImpC
MRKNFYANLSMIFHSKLLRNFTGVKNMSINTSDIETKFTFEKEAAAQIEDMPFRLLLLGNWSGKNNRSALRERSAIEIDRDNFDDVLRKMRIEIRLDLQGGGKDFVQLRFEEAEDFHPDKIYHKVPLFADLRETRERLMNPQTFHRTAVSLRTDDEKTVENLKREEAQVSPVENQPEASGSLLDRILSQSDTAAAQKQTSSKPEGDLDNLIRRLVKPHLVNIDETEQAKLVAAVDEATGELMRTILHHPDFKALESAWRAAYLLISRIETNSNIKIYLFEADKEELSADLKSVKNLSESEFYKLLNEKAADSAGNDFWAAICGNYTFNSDVEDIATLMRIAKIAQASETAFIAQASPEISGIKSLSETLEPDSGNLPENSGKEELWKMLRALEEASFIGLTIPRFLGRMPYGSKSDPTETFSFEEILSPNDDQSYLWINSSFACGLLLAQSFSSYGWEIGENLIRDISDLPVYIYKDESQTIIKPITETAINADAAEKIIERGLMPLVSFRDSDAVRLARFQSIASPPRVLRGKWNL